MEVDTMALVNECDLPQLQLSKQVQAHASRGLSVGVDLNFVRRRFQHEGYDKTARMCGSWKEIQKECRRQEKFLKQFITPEAVEINKLIARNTGGKEHDVLLDTTHRKAYKRVKDPKVRWGRTEWTPYEYLESLAGFNELAPAVGISLVGAALHKNSVTLVTEMPLVAGPYPTPSDLHDKLLKLGFEQYVDGASKTVDYRKGNIVIFDAHHKNFILDTSTGEVVPIDLQVKLLHF